MAMTLQPGLEPIPGYKLVSRLGSGGFGEVWKVQAPGGFRKAMKFVAGDITSNDKSQPAFQELNALQRILSIRHPFILSLERYDIVGGQLLIVMELADRNLHHRCKECQTAGQPGVPREELLRYMEETAEALDFMNFQHGLQHLDIKPANLFLVQNHVKVADFGLVKNKEAMQTEKGGGVTFDYAPPELWLGSMSRYCDQYSLAVSYQELLTGTRPFLAKTMSEWKQQHMGYPPNVAPLPKGDQEIIARALAKKPKERWRNCLEMVQALRKVGVEVPVKVGSIVRPGPTLHETLTPVSGTHQVAVNCPSCQKQGKVPVGFQGREVKCPRCQKPFRVPEPPPVIPDEIRLAPVEDANIPTPLEINIETELLTEAKCTSCGHKGLVPEKYLGKKIKCRKCATVFVIGGTTPVPKKQT